MVEGGQIGAYRVTMTTYREVDETMGLDVPGGCTSTLQGLQFELRQMP